MSEKQYNYYSTNRIQINNGKIHKESWIGGYAYEITADNKVKYFVLPNNSENTAHDCDKYTEVTRVEYDMIVSRVKRDINETYCRENCIVDLPVYTNPFSGLNSMVESIEIEKQKLRQIIK